MRKNKTKRFIPLLIILLLGIGLGYALLSQDLTINGTTKVKGNTWDIHFNNVQVSSGSVTLSTGDSAAAINQTDDTLVEYTVSLNQPGDFYEFTVDAVNAGTVDGMIGEIVTKLNGTAISSTNPLPSYLKYTFKYDDGIEIAPKHILEAGHTETFIVRIEFKREIENSELPTTEQTNAFSFGVNYVQIDDTAIAVPHPINFSTDSWETILLAIENNNLSAYHVGDTKTIELGNDLGTHMLRIANMSSPSECSGSGFSQTACGLVLEFTDIITAYSMYTTDTNYGGWTNSRIRTLLNDTNSATSIINSLPTIVKDAIIDTTVVSGHGSTSGNNNFVTTDKLYLLGTHEVWEDADGNANDGISYFDSAYSGTRQLDYYANLNVTTSDYSHAIKQYNEEADYWWLRSADITVERGFWSVNQTGKWSYNYASNAYGVSPAFRLG